MSFFGCRWWWTRNFSRFHLYSFIKIYYGEYKNWIMDPFSCRLIFNCHFSSHCRLSLVLLCIIFLLFHIVGIELPVGGHFYSTFFCSLLYRFVEFCQPQKRHLKRDLLAFSRNSIFILPSSSCLLCLFVIAHFCMISIRHMWNAVEFNGIKFWFSIHGKISSKSWNIRMQMERTI